MQFYQIISKAKILMFKGKLTKEPFSKIVNEKHPLIQCWEPKKKKK